MDLFHGSERDQAPIPFEPRPNSQIDDKIYGLLMSKRVRVPVIHLQKSMYFIGIHKV